MARQENSRLRGIDDHIFLLYVFSFDLNDCSLKIKQLDHSETGLAFMKNEDDYYRLYDLLWHGYIMKVTPRRLENSVPLRDVMHHPEESRGPAGSASPTLGNPKNKRHQFLSLEAIYIAYNGIISDPEDFQYLLYQFEEARAVSDDITPTPKITPQQPFYLRISAKTTLTLMRIWTPTSSSQRGGRRKINHI